MSSENNVSFFKRITYLWGDISRLYGKRHPKWLIGRVYKLLLGREMNWDDPKDLNEKINWLKLHVDPYEWSVLADKYRVREYVKDRGLEEILIPLYGHWKSSEEVIADWNKLPDEFVLKCNNGNGKVKIVSKKNGGKSAINMLDLRKELDNWISSSYCGISGTEPHYSLIDNCIIAEELLHDAGDESFSDSIVDYKIWCFNGKPYGCFVCYNRDIETKNKDVAFYDNNWNFHPEYLSISANNHQIKKPEKWSQMLDVAAKLSKGQPQVRVDLYYASGNIYFGEMTMTARGGFMTVFTQDALLDMGRQIVLDLETPGNMFCK